VIQNLLEFLGGFGPLGARPDKPRHAHKWDRERRRTQKRR
jgi:hypothetical protein